MHASCQSADAMTGTSRTSSGADTLKAYVLRSETVLRVGTWNIRTLYQTSQVVKEFDKYRLSFLVMTEATLIGHGKKVHNS